MATLTRHGSLGRDPAGSMHEMQHSLCKNWLHGPELNRRVSRFQTVNEKRKRENKAKKKFQPILFSIFGQPFYTWVSPSLTVIITV